MFANVINYFLAFEYIIIFSLPLYEVSTIISMLQRRTLSLDYSNDLEGKIEIGNSCPSLNLKSKFLTALLHYIVLCDYMKSGRKMQIYLFLFHQQESWH